MKKMVLRKRALKRGTTQPAPINLDECFIASGTDPNSIELHGYNIDDNHRRYTITLNSELVTAVTKFARAALP
ncbi:MAG: hypothetical protein KDE14_04820 [Rhodobacteraceae bacterium]|nr:hypothetical protein [Paracoccaceae bacterium]